MASIFAANPIVRRRGGEQRVASKTAPGRQIFGRAQVGGGQAKDIARLQVFQAHPQFEREFAATLIASVP